MTDTSHKRHVILSGCSGGGKSTLLAALGRAGFHTVAEPGRRIVAQEMGGRGAALPWVDPAAFARRAVEMATRDRASLGEPIGWVFFDRGLIDAAVALEHAEGTDVAKSLAGTARFHPLVFMAPPWPKLYRTDGERRHGFDAAVDEYHRLCKAYDRLGYTLVLLPKIGVAERAVFVLNRLG
ncbi:MULTISPECIES: AAA family ATPase [unclassified Roseovarius]|uniref:AAA family ATPase n=1 Tax=unclassified Roseovarius TaxID=2614913 RepID=UPI00273F4918|nr:AAA family ATPase [Roseovarius sp. MMSF_3350]